MNEMRDRESEIESNGQCVTQPQPRHAFVTRCHDVRLPAYHLLLEVPAQPLLPSIPVIFCRRTGVYEKSVFHHLFTLKGKMGNTRRGLGDNNWGDIRGEYAALQPMNVVRAGEGESFFAHFFVVTLPSAIHFARLAAVADLL